MFCNHHRSKLCHQLWLSNTLDLLLSPSNRSLLCSQRGFFRTSVLRPVRVAVIFPVRMAVFIPVLVAVFIPVLVAVFTPVLTPVLMAVLVPVFIPALLRVLITADQARRCQLVLTGLLSPAGKNQRFLNLKTFQQELRRLNQIYRLNLKNTVSKFSFKEASILRKTVV